MAKKRKSDASPVDEFDRTLHSAFCSAANSLSQIYTQATNQKNVAFQVGERHALEKVYEWISRQHEEGSRVTAADIVAYLQNEIKYKEDSSTSLRLAFQHQHPQPTGSSIQASGQTTVGLSPRTAQVDQTKNLVFSNALSSPVCQSLQNYHISQVDGGCFPTGALSSGFGDRNHEASHLPLGFGDRNDEARNQEFDYNDSVMDMHSDSSTHNSY